MTSSYDIMYSAGYVALAAFTWPLTILGYAGSIDSPWTMVMDRYGEI